MLAPEATWFAFAAFSGLRTISYVPQIVRIARDSNGASAISYPTWLLWTGANATTAMYAATNLNDIWLAFVSSVYALCCLVVIALTVFKRLAHRRMNMSVAEQQSIAACHRIFRPPRTHDVDLNSRSAISRAR